MEYHVTLPDGESTPTFNNPVELAEWLADGLDVDIPVLLSEWDVRVWLQGFPAWKLHAVP